MSKLVQLLVLFCKLQILFAYTQQTWSRERGVRIGTRLLVGRSRDCASILVTWNGYLASTFQKVLGPNQLGTGCSLPKVRWPGREAAHSPPTITEDKNKWSYTFTPQHALMACTNTTFFNSVPSGSSFTNNKEDLKHSCSKAIT